MPTKSLFFYDNEIQYTFTFHPSHVDVMTDKQSFIIRPDAENRINAFALIPSIPSYCEINRWRTIPFGRLPSTISYAIENSLITVTNDYDLSFEIRLDEHLDSLLHTCRQVDETISIIFTAYTLKDAMIGSVIDSTPGLHVLEPVDIADFNSLYPWALDGPISYADFSS